MRCFPLMKVFGMGKRLQDTVKFVITEEGAVVTKTIRVTATLTGIITPEKTEDQLTSDIRGVVQRFIANVDWQFSNTTRRSHPSGYEEFSVTATVRAPIAEHYALDQRAKDASPDAGLKISNIQVDTNPPQGDIQAAEQKLRLQVMKTAQDEAKAFTEATKREYRVGVIDFTGMQQGMNRPMPMAYAAAAPMGGTDPGSAPIDNTLKLTMTGYVTLCTSPK